MSESLDVAELQEAIEAGTVDQWFARKEREMDELLGEAEPGRLRAGGRTEA